MVRLLSLFAVGAAALEADFAPGSEELCEADEGSCALSLAQKRAWRRASPHAGPAEAQGQQDGGEDDPTLWVHSAAQKARQEQKFEAIVAEKTTALESQQHSAIALERQQRSAMRDAAADFELRAAAPDSGVSLILGRHGVNSEHGVAGRHSSKAGEGKKQQKELVQTHPEPGSWPPAHAAQDKEPSTLKEILAYESDTEASPTQSRASRGDEKQTQKRHAHHTHVEEDEAPKDVLEDDLVPLDEAQFVESADHSAADKKSSKKQATSKRHAHHAHAEEEAPKEVPEGDLVPLDRAQAELPAAQNASPKHHARRVHTEEEAPQEDFGHPEWLKTCHSILLDVGSGQGNNVRKVFEPRRFQGSQLLRTLDNYVGSAGWRRAQFEQTGLCVLGLEPNEKHRARLHLLEDSYNVLGWRVHFYPFAAYKTSGFVELNTTSIEGWQDGDEQPGAHLMTVNGVSEEQGPAKVRVVDLAGFIRSLPGDRLSLVILDMEGAEYETLAHLMQEDLVCTKTMRRLLVDAHSWGDIDSWGNATTFPEGVHPRSFDAVQERFAQLNQHGWCKPENTTQVSVFEEDNHTVNAVDDWLNKQLAQGITEAPAKAELLVLEDGPVGPLSLHTNPVAVPVVQPPVPGAPADASAGYAVSLREGESQPQTDWMLQRVRRHAISGRSAQ